MCGRYWIDRSEETDDIIKQAERSPLLDRIHGSASHALVSSGEVRPADLVPVIAPDRQGMRAVFPMRWGFRGKSLVINARVETSPEKRLFRDA